MSNELQALLVPVVAMFFSSATLSRVLEVCLFGFSAQIFILFFRPRKRPLVGLVWFSIVLVLLFICFAMVMLLNCFVNVSACSKL